MKHINSIEHVELSKLPQAALIQAVRVATSQAALWHSTARLVGWIAIAGWIVAVGAVAWGLGR